LNTFVMNQNLFILKVSREQERKLISLVIIPKALQIIFKRLYRNNKSHIDFILKIKIRNYFHFQEEWFTEPCSQRVTEPVQWPTLLGRSNLQVQEQRHWSQTGNS
jgi:hypothetical protein